ncbi:signal recognition particle protein [candidate division KSB1 bacterium]|nr:signal recognition particle protein [candidate division KSB1 bacterium]
MFEDLIQKLDIAVRKIRGSAKLTEANIADSLREIRRVLLEADVHFRVVKEFIAAVQEKAVGQEVLKSISPGQQVVKIFHDELVSLLGQSRVPLQFSHVPPSVIMVVGLQGSGKTTFCAKLATHLRKQGHNPILVAGDIYRPAAIDQLIMLGKSIDIPVFNQGKENPVTIVKKGISEARKKGHDTLILDTAGRLHIDNEMMQELVSVQKAVKPIEILYVADSMTGQDAVNSAKAFLDQLDFTGIVLTKLDGDARGGAILSIRSITDRPVKFISNGEKLDQIEPFHPDRMASRILGMGDVVTLVEKAQESIDQEEAEELATKLQKQFFTFEDFLDQLQQMKKMGPLSQIMGMLPGMSGRMNQLEVDDHALVKIEAMIQSMTAEERHKPQIINGSRRKRIAVGSGTTVQDLNRLLKQFQMMQKMMKKMGRMKKGKMMQGMPPGLQF